MFMKVKLLGNKMLREWKINAHHMVDSRVFWYWTKMFGK